MSFQSNEKCVALYRMENVNDSSGNSHTLINNGTITFITGKFSNCANLGNPNSSKYFSHDELGVNLSGVHGFSSWVYLLAAPGSSLISIFCDWRSTTGTARYVIPYYQNDAGTMRLAINNQGTITSTAYTLPLNTWFKIDYTNNAINGYIYINSILRLTAPNGSTSNSNNALGIGGYYNGAANGFIHGYLEESIFYNYHRTAEAIRKMYAFQTGRLV